MVCLLDLPAEVLLEILAFLSPGSLCRVSLACRLLSDLAMEEQVWVARARQERGLRLQPSAEFSARQFYQSCLHRLGPLLGLWQRTKGAPYGGLLRLTYRDHSIVAEVVKPGRSAMDPFTAVPVLVARAGRNGGGPRVEQLDRFLYQLGGIQILDPRFGEKKDKPVVKYQALDVTRDPQGSPLGPGLFAAYYGPHGTEIIHLQLGGQGGSSKRGGMDGVSQGLAGLHGGISRGKSPQENPRSSPARPIYLRGVKITGDPNVPAGEVTFEVTDHRCLALSRQQQKTCSNIEECDEFVEYEENMELPFVSPKDCYGGKNAFLETQKSCQGRWVAKAQIADHNFTNPWMISANFIKFNNDLFAVIFLELKCVILYKRWYDL